VCVCRASLIRLYLGARYEWLPAFDDSLTSNAKSVPYTTVYATVLYYDYDYDYDYDSTTTTTRLLLLLLQASILHTHYRKDFLFASMARPKYPPGQAK